MRETARTTARLVARKRKRRLVLRLSIVVQDPTGNRRTVRTQVVPRLAAARRSAKGRARQAP